MYRNDIVIYSPFITPVTFLCSLSPEEAFVSSRSVVLLCSLCVVGFVMTQFAVVFVNVDCFRIMEHEK